MHYCQPMLSPNGEWVALREGGDEPHVEVWQLGDDGSLAERLFNSHTVEGRPLEQCATWCGDLLVYSRVTGVSNFHELDMNAPPEGHYNFLAANSATVAYDPRTGVERRVADEMFYALLGDASGRRLIGFNPVTQYARGGTVPGAHCSTARKYLMPEGIVQSTRVLRLGGHIMSRGFPRPLWWVPPPGGFYVLDERATDPRRDGLKLLSRKMLMYVSEEGEVSDVSDEKGDAMLWPYGGGPLLPALSPVDRGARVASFLHKSGSRYGLGVFGPDGMIRRHDYGTVRWAFPKALAEIGTYWSPISCAPDGKRALFQQRRTWDDDPSNDTSLQVWCWDVEADEGFLVTSMLEIDQCFGWLSDDALVVAATCVGDDGRRPTGDYDYGVLHLHKPPEGQAGETEGEQHQQEGDDR